MIDQLCFEALLPIVADSIIPQRENLFVVICLHCNHWTDGIVQICVRVPGLVQRPLSS